jgi:hypothetical protein
MAIAGLVLLIVAPVYFTTFYITSKQRELDAEMALMVEMAPPQYNAIRLRIHTGNTNVTEPEKQLVEKFDKLDLERVRAERVVELYQSHSSLLKKATVCVSIFGFLLMMSGFCFWYRRVQVPLDHILAKQVQVVDMKAAMSQEIEKEMD